MTTLKQRIEEAFVVYFNNVSKEQITADTYMAGALFGLSLAIEMLKSKPIWGGDGSSHPFDEAAGWLESKLKEE